MRIWTLHPQYLDVKGFVALWRETLLAQNALLGNTKGWANHPQLLPFRNGGADNLKSLRYIANYLHLLCPEAKRRGYTFTYTKILFPYDSALEPIPTRQKVLDEEWQILLSRYPKRSPKWYANVKDIREVGPHESFVVVN